jgi:hypothetical protein
VLRADYPPKGFEMAAKLLQWAKNKQKLTKKSKQLGSPLRETKGFGPKLANPLDSETVCSLAPGSME